MLKKAKAQLGAPQVEQVRDLAEAVMDSSHKIWLAGLGAFSKAQQEGMKVFDTLVKEGEALEAQTRRVASATAEAATEAARAKAKEMQAMAGGTWDKLEQVFEERVARALHRLGVYRSSDFQELAKRVNSLSDALGQMIMMKPVSAPRAAKKEAAKKPAARKARAGRAAPAAKAAAGARKTVAKAARGTARKAGAVAKAAEG
jgi:poly(hydroxyalkanoate) granule-associated protein